MKQAKKKDIGDSISYNYHSISVECACGATYTAGSTKESIRVDICANCHPYFTGESKIIDAEGRVEKFRKKYNLAEKG